MRHFLDALKNVTTIAKSFGRKTTTVQFPKELRPRAERYRASFALLHEADGDEACIGCLQCERICPSKVISIKGPAKKDSPITGKKRSYADDFTLDLSACIFCELCVQVCPADAIVMTREQEEPAYGRESLVLTMAKLYENEKKKTRSWGDGTKLMEMQVPPKPPAPAKPAVAAAPAAASSAVPGASVAPAAAAAPATAATPAAVAAAAATPAAAATLAAVAASPAAASPAAASPAAASPAAASPAAATP
ncbi:MAG: 4Fe-4S dicluster domain-containing protein, partial [Archangiaceae bacterium]|nr:4Fe-4S dicluster domain-containing protein [Archangiaceae bacterium]